MTLDPAALAQTHAAANTVDRAWSAEEFAALLQGAGVEVFGCAQSFVVARVVTDEAEILTVATHPSARHRGRARAALEACHAALRSRGVARVFLEVAEDNAAARALYVAAGYRETGRRAGYYARHGERVDALMLVRDLHRGGTV